VRNQQPDSPCQTLSNFFAAGPKLWQNGGIGTGRLGVCMSWRVTCLRKTCLILLVVISSTVVLAQVSHSEQVQIMPPLIRAVEPPAPDATAADLEIQGDRLRSEKL
jgi:hypothetical protein